MGRFLLVASLCVAVAALVGGTVAVDLPRVVRWDGHECLNPEETGGPFTPTEWTPFQETTGSAAVRRLKGPYAFNWRTALFLVRVTYPTMRAFCNHERLDTDLIGNGFHSVGVVYGWEGPDDSRRNMFGEVLTNDDSVIIMLRGTASLDGVLADIKIARETKAADFPGSVHAGFWEIYTHSQKATYDDRVHAHRQGKEIEDNWDTQFDTMRKQIKMLVERADYKGKHVYFGGHSLGAALSTLCAYGLSLDLPDAKVFGLNFGSPRVGDAEFAEAFNKRLPSVWRLVNVADPVPKVPPKLIGYHHVGKPMTFTRLKTVRAITKNFVQLAHTWSYEDEAKDNLGMPLEQAVNSMTVTDVTLHSNRRSVRVKWDNDGCDKPVLLALYRGTTQVDGVLEEARRHRPTTITLPSSLPSSSRYRVYLAADGGAGCEVFSDYFSI